MATNSAPRWCIIIFLCAILLGCSESTLDPQKPTKLTFWHVFGAQTNGPMNAMVDRFNQTVGREKGIVVSVTGVSNSADIHFALAAAARRQPGAGNLPDMFIGYPKTALAIGAERFMDWKDWLGPEALNEYVPSFVGEGMADERLLVFPLLKSTNVLFVNATIFEQFAKATGVSYADLQTWEGMLRAAELYYQWSGGKAFFKYDDWLHYSMLGTASLGGAFFADGSINFKDEQLQKVWRQLAQAAVSGQVCLLGGSSTTAMMTGEAVCGIASTSAILYFQENVILPNNTTMPLGLKILPVPRFADGQMLALQRGGGLMALKSTREKEHAVAVFGQWLTEEANNMLLAIVTGHLPVKMKPCLALLQDKNLSSLNQAYQRLYANTAGPSPATASPQSPEAKPTFIMNQVYQQLYAAISDIYATHTFWVPPYFDRYGEVERQFVNAQMEIFAKYHQAVLAGQAINPTLTQKMFNELEQALQ